MTPLRTGCALIALFAATPALAQTPNADDLATLVRAQAAEIVALKARLDRLEGAQQVAAEPPPPRHWRRRRMRTIWRPWSARRPRRSWR